MKKLIKRILIISIVIFFIIGSFFVFKSKKNLDNNPLEKELKKIMEDPEIKQIFLSHKANNKEKNLEKVNHDHEKTELTVSYNGSFFVENSQETFAFFEWHNGEKNIRIAIDSENPVLQEKNIKRLGARLKFKISFFGKDVQKNWRAGREGAGYWSDYWYFDKSKTNFKLETLPFQWENTQNLNSNFFGKWKIDLRKSIESGFSKITPRIEQRMEKELSRENIHRQLIQTEWNQFLGVEIVLEDNLPTLHYWSNGTGTITGSTFFWIKNLDDYTMACFTNFHPNHSFGILENDALLTIFKLDKSRKKLTIYNPWIVRDFCTSISVDWEKILGWVPWTTNREYNRLKPYFQENARIIATKIE